MTDASMKNAIADKYIELINSNPPHKVTVSELSKECGISRQTFYYHFDDLTDVIDFAMRFRIDTLRNECMKEISPKECIRLTVRAIADSIPLISVLEKSPDSSKYREHSKNAIKGLMEEYIMKRASRASSYTDEELKILLSIYSWGLMGVAVESIREFKQMDIDTVTEQLYRVFSGDSPLI